ncbi:MAG: Ada metal-binding domain-containing protein [archaeon]
MGGRYLYFVMLVLILVNLLFTAVVTTGAYGPIAWYTLIFILMFIAAAAFFIGHFMRRSWSNLSLTIFFILAIINSIVFWALAKNLSGALLLVINIAGLEFAFLEMRWFRKMTSSRHYFSKEKELERELPDIEEPGIIIEEDFEDESPIKFIGNTATGTFHIPACRYAKQVKAANKVFFDSRREAIKNKYKACKCTKG